MKFSVCIFSRFSKYDGMLLFHQSGDKNAISQKCQLLSAPVLNQKRDQFACLSSVVGSPWIQKNFNISAFGKTSAKAGRECKLWKDENCLGVQQQQQKKTSRRG